MRAGLFMSVTAASRGVVVARMPARRGLAPLTDIPDGECRHGTPELVIRGKDAVVARPVSAARWTSVIGRAGRNAGGASQPAWSAAGTNTPAVTHAWKCTWWLSAELKRCRKEMPPSLDPGGFGRVGVTRHA